MARWRSAMSGRQPAAASRSVFVICDWTIEQDHRNVKRRTWLAKGYGSVATAWRTLRAIEAMDMIRKGRVRDGWPREILLAKRSSSVSCSRRNHTVDQAFFAPADFRNESL